MTPQERYELETAALNHKLFHEMMDKRVIIPKCETLEEIKYWVSTWPEPKEYIDFSKPSPLPSEVEKTLNELQELISATKKGIQQKNSL